LQRDVPIHLGMYELAARPGPRTLDAYPVSTEKSMGIDRKRQRGQGMTEYLMKNETRIFIGLAGRYCLRIQHLSNCRRLKLDAYPAFLRGLATTLVLLSRR
jgi:hypothetical protein